MRPNLYGMIHKAIRRLLCQLVLDTGSVDPADAPALVALSARLVDLSAFLAQHAEHEERFVHPYIQRVEAALVKSLETGHHELEARMNDALRAYSAMVEAEGSARPAAVGAAYGAISGFVTAYCAHMEEEETLAMSALWQGYEDATLLGINDAIIQSMPPEETARSFGPILLALNGHERAEVLNGIRMTAPPEAFHGMWMLAQSVLSAADVRALGGRLGLAVAA